MYKEYGYKNGLILPFLTLNTACLGLAATMIRLYMSAFPVSVSVRCIDVCSDNPGPRLHRWNPSSSFCLHFFIVYLIPFSQTSSSQGAFVPNSPLSLRWCYFFFNLWQLDSEICLNYGNISSYILTLFLLISVFLLVTFPLRGWKQIISNQRMQYHPSLARTWQIHICTSWGEKAFNPVSIKSAISLDWSRVEWQLMGS